MNVTQWTALIRSDMPWQKRNAEIARVVKEYLDALQPNEVRDTRTLVESLMPIAICRGEQIEARNYLFTILMKLAKGHELVDYSHKSDETKKRFGRQVFPWVWHANRKPVARCPHCDGVL